jgi:hypothetical protein
MSKFQIGDRVEFVENYGEHFPKGTQSTVTRLSPALEGEEDDIVGVKRDDGKTGSCFEYRVKLVEEKALSEFRFRSDEGAYSFDGYQSFEDALAGFKEHSRGENEAEIVEIISHGKYKAVLKIEAV